MGKAGGSVPDICAAFIASDHVRYVGGPGVVAVSDYSLVDRIAKDYEDVKLGFVNHIPVCDTLDQLTAYFTGGQATGCTHFGIDRATSGLFEWNGWRFPVARIDQYLPVTGPLSPWAQGVRAWVDNPACPIKVPAHLRALKPILANVAFISCENVARTGSQGVTDAQYNSNVLLRTWNAGHFRYPVNPQTQLWHAEFSPTTRCYDPGWTGALEDEMQEAARKLLAGDISGLRQVQRIAVINPPKPATPNLPKEEPVIDASIEARITGLEQHVDSLERRLAELNTAFVEERFPLMREALELFSQALAPDRTSVRAALEDARRP